MATAFRTTQNGLMATEHGWVVYTPGDNSHLTDEQRELVEARIRERKERQGRLLAIVEVRVYEHGAEPQVNFPPDAVMGVNTPSSEVAEVVARAREELGNWR